MIRHNPRRLGPFALEEFLSTAEILQQCPLVVVPG